MIYTSIDITITMNETTQSFKVHIGDYAFDMLHDIPNIPMDLKIEDPSDSDHYIIQFNKTLTREERQRLKDEYRVQLKNYIPNYSYLEYLEKGMIPKISNDILFRAIIPFHPTFKIPSKLMRRIYKSRDRNTIPDIKLFANLFEETIVESIVKSLYNEGLVAGDYR